MDPFKVGDIVRVVTGSSRRAGELGKIKGQCEGYSESYWVAFIDGTVDLFEVDCLEPASADLIEPGPQQS
jgi:hypothetical protein